MKLRIKSMIWNIRKQKTTNQNNKKKKKSKKIRIWKQPLGQPKVFQLNFFNDSFNAFAHFMMCDLRVYLPTPCGALSSFDPKWQDPSAPHSLLTLSHPQQFFVVCFPDEKSHPKETFC